MYKLKMSSLYTVSSEFSDRKTNVSYDNIYPTDCSSIEDFQPCCSIKEKGDSGEKGDTGPKGEKGNRGEKGDTGPMGPSGLQGPEGPQGCQGIKGDDGCQGEKGDTGARGPKGQKGDNGTQGQRGPTGVRGPRGETGDKGPRGDTGEKGDTGICVCDPIVEKIRKNKIVIIDKDYKVLPYDDYIIVDSDKQITIQLYELKQKLQKNCHQETRPINIKFLSTELSKNIQHKVIVYNEKNKINGLHMMAKINNGTTLKIVPCGTNWYTY